ncbi:MAG: hypothetical protein GFGODING_02067 [Flavobacteriales bacterium]|nr:hypothetical protein [Flavobacteriales bacterium]
MAHGGEPAHVQVVGKDHLVLAYHTSPPTIKAHVNNRQIKRLGTWPCPDINRIVEKIVGIRCFRFWKNKHTLWYRESLWVLIRVPTRAQTGPVEHGVTQRIGHEGAIGAEEQVAIYIRDIGGSPPEADIARHRGDHQTACFEFKIHSAEWR